MSRELKLINKLYPWYSGLSSDLIFYIAINTIWLTTVKGFSDTEITFLFTISSLFMIFFQIPSLMIIKKIGNTNCIRVGSFLLLISSIMLTFCTKYFLFCLANIFLEMALVFSTMNSILIKNNLQYQNMGNYYVKIRSKSSLIYALSTAFITLFIGVLFNIHKYLPMILGIFVCLFCFIISFFIYDINDKVNKKENSTRIKNNLIPKPFNLFVLIFIFYGFLFAIIAIGQQNGKLLIQHQLLSFFSIETVVTYVGIILFISRIIRVIINYLYPLIYSKIKNNMCILLSFYMFISISLLLLGFYLNIDLNFKLLFMTLGFSAFPSLREPIKIYVENLVLETFDKKYQKDALVYLSLSTYIGKFIFSFLATLILIKFPLQYLFILFLLIIIPLIFLSFKIIKKLKILK